MVEKPQIDDPNAALARLVAENVLATNRATHATRVLASGIYYSTLASLVALIPAVIGLLLLAGDQRAAIFFFVVAGVVIVAISVRSIVVMFEEYRASSPPEPGRHEIELMALVADAGSSREELAEVKKQETTERYAREIERARELATEQERARLEQAAREESAREAARLGVLGHDVGDTRLIGGWPPQAVWARA